MAKYLFKSNIFAQLSEIVEADSEKEVWNKIRNQKSFEIKQKVLKVYPSSIEITKIKEKKEKSNMEYNKEKTAEQRLEEKVEIKEAINPEVTNLEYYKDEILENCIENLAVVKGRPKLCYKTNCNDCDFKINQKECHKMAKDWLKHPHEKPVYKLTKFEKELLECYSDVYSFKVFNSLNGMKEKGYFKGIDDNELIGETLAKCEVV